MADAPAGRTLLPGQSCRVHVTTIDGDRLVDRVVHRSYDRLYEAPNWDERGRLVLNADGRLFELDVDGVHAPEAIATRDLPPVNNDHVLSPDGASIHASADDGHIHTVARRGGEARRVTGDDATLHFLHGASPDGRRLAYVAIARSEPMRWVGHVREVGVDGTDDRPVTSPGEWHDDGPEYDADGAWVYFNTERFTQVPGHAQIARVRPDGSDLERLTHNERVDWFPHLSPDGLRAVYLSFPPGTHGHPENLPVTLCVVDLPHWDSPVHQLELFGGQGTINVNSWAPDSSAFAWADYPLG